MKAISSDIEFRGSEDKTFENDDGKNIANTFYVGTNIQNNILKRK